MCNDANQWVRVADRIVSAGTSLPPFVRFGPKADKRGHNWIVRFVPIATDAPQQTDAMGGYLAAARERQRCHPCPNVQRTVRFSPEKYRRR